MKRSVIILLAFLVGLFMILSRCDPQEDYAVEQMLWKVNKRFTELAQDPSVVPEQIFDDIASQYQAIINRAPSSQLVPKTQLMMGRVYLLKRDYPKARATLHSLLEKSLDKPEIAAEALSLVGNSYELAGDLPNAVATYQKIQEQYPLTALGLNTPLYIANFYRRGGYQGEAQKAFSEAESYYQSLSKEYARSAIGFEALRLATSTYFLQKKWQEGIETLSELLLTYADTLLMTPPKLTVILRTIYTIGISELNNPDLPVTIYRSFIEKYPDHPLKDVIEETITRLQQSKDNASSPQRVE